MKLTLVNKNLKNLRALNFSKILIKNIKNWY